MALWRRFGGAQPPTNSPRKTWQSQCACAKTHSHSAADFVPSSPRRLRVLSVSSVLRRDRHKETHKPEVNQPSPITARQPENALMAIPTHGGIGTEHSASRSVWRCASNSRREQTQDISIERQGPVRASDGPSTSYTIRKGTPAANGRLSFYIGFVRAVRSSARRGNGFCALWRA